MIGKGVGVLALAAVLGFVSYYETSFLQLQQLSAAAPAAVGGTIAQVSTPSSGSAAPASTATRVDGTCIAGQSIVVTVDEKGAHAVSSCNPAAANTCKVTVNAPNNETETVNYCCDPVTGVCQCVEGAPAACKPIPLDPATWYTKRYQAKCAKNNTPLNSSSPKTMVRPQSQLATAAGPVPCNSAKVADLIAKGGKQSKSSGSGYSEDISKGSLDLSANAKKTPQAPAQQRTEFNNAYNPTSGAQAPVQKQTTQSGSGYFEQIKAEGASGATAPGQASQTTLPSQPQQAAPGGPAFEQGGVYRPGGTNPSGGLTGGARPSYFSPSRAQNTFGGTGFSGSRSSGSRVASSFISGFASLIGGLFSVPTNSVVNYVQSFVGGSSQQQQTPANQNGGQQQTYAPGQVVIVVPYPMPTSRTTVGGQLTQLPPPPTSTPDAYAELRELARQANATTGSPAQTGGQEDRITSAFSGQEGDTRPGTVPAGNQNASGESRATPAAGRQGGLSQSAEQSGATSVPGEKATSTHATSTSYKEPRVVEVGIPVDITDLGSYETVLAYLKGDWARTERTALQNKVALAQAEVQQEAIKAQLEALQDARAAGLCDDSCAASLTVLQNELPVLQSRVEALQTAVEKDAQPRPSSPPPTVAQISRVAESLAEPTYKATIPRSGASEPTAVSVSEQEALPEVQQTKSEAVVTRVVQSIWNFLKSWFLPPATEAAKPRPSCSLFASLFGKCK